VCSPATLQEHGIPSQLALAEQQAVCAFQRECQKDTLSYFQLQLSMDDAMHARLTAQLPALCLQHLWWTLKYPKHLMMLLQPAHHMLRKGLKKDGAANCTNHALAYGF
jgi:hypothetical protein